MVRALLVAWPSKKTHKLDPDEIKTFSRGLVGHPLDRFGSVGARKDKADWNPSPRPYVFMASWD